MIDYELILIFAAFGFVWSEVLTQPGMIFGWLASTIKATPEWVQKPLYSCAVCVTGFWSTYAVLLLTYMGHMSFLSAITYPVLSILLTKIFLRYA